MTKIICPSVECKFCNDNHICTAKEIKLTFRNMVTVNEGRVDMWICNKYEMDDTSKELVQNFKDWFANHPDFKGE